MKKKRGKSNSPFPDDGYRDNFVVGDKVMTPDGEGVFIGRSLQTTSNKGGGNRVAAIQLNDGRKRHYQRNAVTKLPIVEEKKQPSYEYPWWFRK